MISLEPVLRRPPKQQQVQARLIEMAQRLGAGAQMPKAVELRDEMGVSMATLNSALNELEAQGVVTRKRAVGIFVSPQLHQKTVAVLCDSRLLRAEGHSPFWDRLFETVRARAQSHNERLEIHLASAHQPNNVPFESGSVWQIDAGQFNGVIGVGLSEEAVRWVEEREIPFVSLFGPKFSPHSVSVNLDTELLVELGVKTLRERGCQRIGIWFSVEPFTPRAPDPLNVERETRRILQEFDLPVEGFVELNQHLVPEVGSQTEQSSREQGYETARRVFGRPRSQWPDGIVIVLDTMTRGASLALQSLGICIGRDVQIVSHSNKETSVSLPSGLTALVEVDPLQIVETTFAQLEILMNGDTPSQFEFNLPPLLRI